MKIILTSVLVDDQDKAHAFYTEKLGFVTKHDFPAGGARWLTVVSPEGGDVELLLEPDWNPQLQINGEPAARVWKKTLRDNGVPAASFGVSDVRAEYQRLTELGVSFVTEPTDMGPVTTAVLDDTCGNLIMISQLKDDPA